MKRKITILTLTVLTQLFAVGAYASNTSCSYFTDENTTLVRMAQKSAITFGIAPKEIKAEFQRILEDEKKFNLSSGFSMSYLFNCDLDSNGSNYSSMRQALVDYILNF